MERQGEGSPPVPPMTEATAAPRPPPLLPHHFPSLHNQARLQAGPATSHRPEELRKVHPPQRVSRKACTSLEEEVWVLGLMPRHGGLQSDVGWQREEP